MEESTLIRVAFLAALLAVVVLLVVTRPLLAQPPGEAEAAEHGLRWFDFFVLKGGNITLGLIGLSLVTIALAVEHCLTIRRATIIPPAAAGQTQELIDNKQYLEAVQYTAEDPSMMGYVVHAGLMEAPHGYEAMERAIEEALEERAARLFRKIEYLNVIGNVAPMIGLFGTVYGMILLFVSIYQANALPAPQVVADNISIALLTTFWGLVVAIPALSIFAIFRNRIDVLTAECALAAERLLATFKGATGSRPTVTAGTRPARPAGVSPTPPAPGAGVPSTERGARPE
ncbi:MAG TPA: MotA/TolQ/ExbB proton channel family protein [Phycisphaerae bacterium]|nr:MotA/TolQ/ExbB proton channel family protein [Phycisphaerae bacterium]HNU43985.1 MotA/TolQ/ExbB proton channel family protein [Phycisphaerae bacterium]